MKQVRSFAQKNCIANHKGFMPTYWSTISLQANDRTPEVAGVLGGPAS